MSTEQQQQQQLQVTEEQAKECIALRDALVRLENNKDFELLFREEFFKNEAIRLVHLKSDRNMQTEEAKSSIERGMAAVGYLGEFFNKVHQFGEMADNATEDADELREEEEAA